MVFVNMGILGLSARIDGQFDIPIMRVAVTSLAAQAVASMPTPETRVSYRHFNLTFAPAPLYNKGVLLIKPAVRVKTAASYQPNNNKPLF